MRSLGSVTLRSRAWLLGTLLCLAFYGLRSAHLPNRTDVGVEHRLFAVGECTILPEPGGKGYLIGLSAPWPKAGALGRFLQGVQWPGGQVQTRRLTPFREGGTWAIQSWGLRRVWQQQATNVWQNRYLWAGDPIPAALWGEPPPQVLDYHADRRLVGAAAVGLLLRQPLPEVALEALENTADPYYVPANDLTAEGAGLEGLQGALTISQVKATHGITLGWDRDDPAAGILYAISDDDAPRLLRLTQGATPLALSADNRTLYFHRDQALWRLDLRLPLQALLEAATPPPVPVAPH